MASLASSAHAATSVPLGTAANFAVLAGSTVTNTGSSSISGDIGVSPGSAVTGFPPGKVIPPGAIYTADSVAQRAQADLRTAYNNAAGQPGAPIFNNDLAGTTVKAGVHSSVGEIKLNGRLTLDGDGNPDAVFIFKAGSTLITGSDSSVNLINGARASNVFWQVGSSATIGTGSTFAGTILALTSITMNTNATLNGRALARNGAVTMQNNAISPAGIASGGNEDPEAAPVPLRYVALGDSYSSGEGLGEKSAHLGGYLKGGARECHRHRLAYPGIFLWNDRRPQLDFLACSGARTEHIDKKTQRIHERRPQAKREELNKSTNLVTITIGGNDMGKANSTGSGGLSEPLAFCYKHEHCHTNDGFLKRTNDRLNDLGRNLARAYKAIKARTSPEATIAVLGYPRIFPSDTNRGRQAKEQACAAERVPYVAPALPVPKSGFFSWEPREQDFLNAAAGRLNAVIARVAKAQHVYFYNPTNYFMGHAHCDRHESHWIYGLTDKKLRLPFFHGSGSFHPNKLGHRAYRDLLLRELRADVRRIETKTRPGHVTAVGLPANP